VFQPRAIVDHIAGPKPKGRRFGVSYDFYVQRNHYILLVRNFGLLSSPAIRYFGIATASIARGMCWSVGGAVARAAAGLSGTAIGIVLGIFWKWRQGDDPVRRDAEGEAIRKALTGNQSVAPEKAISA
jgi:hypothetical protein